MGVSPFVQRVASRREQMKMPWADVVQLSGVTEARVDALRAGAPAAAWEIEALGKAVGMGTAALYSDTEVDAARSPACFRASGLVEGDGVWRVMRVLAMAAEVGRVAGSLCRQLGRRSAVAEAHDSKPLRGKQNADIGKAGYRLGAAARKRLLPGNEPIADLVGAYAGLGVHVIVVDLGAAARGLDAAAVWEPGALPVVVVNRGSTRVRSSLGAARATLAHELCHLLHDGGPQHLVTALSYGEGAGNYAEGLEVRARAFAPAFLAPPEALRQWVRAAGITVDGWTGAEVVRVCESWGFSYEGAVWHLRNSGVFGAEVAERLMLSGGSPVMLKAFADVAPRLIQLPEALEDVAVGPLWTGLAGDVVVAALSAELLTAGRARELLTWS